MATMRALLVRESSPRPPALEVAVSHALVERVSAGELGAVLRIYRPAPTLAFGRLDRLRPGFGAAVAAAREHGFEPVVRAPGGHAVAYHEGCLVVDEIVPERDPIAGMQDRFARSGERLAEALRTVGVDARVGRIAGEFCPGDFTVSAGGVKLVGTAQRVIRHGSLLAASVAVSGGDALRDVLVDVYAALELDWDPATAGAIERVGPDAVEDAVAGAYEWALTPASLDAETLALAARLEAQHGVEGVADETEALLHKRRPPLASPP
jgi:octanoyl-[GcvH]:protein N-octanoyltransferase